MENNDILVRLRYALDIKDIDMAEMFKLGGGELTKEETVEILTKETIENEADDTEEIVYQMRCDNRMLESFLNGFILFNRGPQESKPGQPDRPPFTIKSHASVNNVVLKKIKIALQLTSDDIIEIIGEAGVTITKGELSALLRKEGHKNYKECGDKYLRNFLKGLALRNRV
ncbi:DUF1456 family protein [Jeotgalibacillus sp. S-D1]|uniref:DUF1456 family protein n=1 Tax=Jeotgalibacillus sp. S-D1 TaxID=2552189 RepID=UPI0010593218|nr:DUF1456 family protein [Jeotgalibacillus sp. S-D1]TDL30595.1 DUF1456 family protein [Jeotgalibacillus sp. S-D1]